MSADERKELHREAAFALASIAGAEIQAAHHALTALGSIPFGDAVEMVVRTGISLPDRAMAEAAALLYERAIEAFSVSLDLDPSTSSWLHLARYRALDETGDPRAEASFQSSTDQIRLLEDPHLVVELAAARLSRSSDGDSRLRDLLLSAHDWIEPTDQGARAAIVAYLALEMAEWVGGTHPADLAAEAQTLAARISDTGVRKLALRATVATSYHRLRADERLEVSAEMLDLAFHTNDPDYHLVGLASRLTDLYCAGRFDDADQVSQETLDLARERQRPRFAALVRAKQAALADARGDDETCSRMVEEVRVECGGITFPDIEIAIVGQDIVRRWREGSISEYADILEAMWHDGSRAPIHAAALAAALAAAGRSNRARQILVGQFGDNLELVPHGTLYLSTLALSAAAVVDLNDEGLAHALLLQFAPHRGTDVVVAGGGGVLGPVETFTGQLHRVLGNYEESRRDLVVARASCQANGFVPLAARLDRLLAVMPG